MANGIEIGTSAISALKLGSSNVSAVYQGTNLIYPVGCQSPLISTASLSAYYKLNGNLNGTVGPSPLSAPNGVTYTTGKFGDANGAAIFNGTTTYLTYVGLNSAYGGSGNNISVMLWINTTNLFDMGDHVINYFNSATNVGWQVTLAGDGLSNSLQVRIASTTLTVASSVPANTWTHIGFTYDNTAGGFKVYINGSLRTSGGSAGMNTNGASIGLRIGVRNTGSFAGSYYAGRMDDINIWQRALTAGEVAILATDCPLT
jgi:hypothetical protein